MSEATRGAADSPAEPVSPVPLPNGAAQSNTAASLKALTASVRAYLETQVVTLTAENGARIFMRGSDFRELFADVAFTPSRKGHIWAQPKRKAPVAPGALKPETL